MSQREPWCSGREPDSHLVKVSGADDRHLNFCLPVRPCFARANTTSYLIMEACSRLHSSHVRSFLTPSKQLLYGKWLDLGCRIKVWKKTYSTLSIHPPKRRREKFLTELVLDRIFAVSVGNSNLHSDLRSRAKFEFPTSTANILSQHRSVIYMGTRNSEGHLVGLNSNGVGFRR